MSSVTVQTLLKTGRILPERSALQGDLKADPGALSPPGECSAHLPSDTSLRLRHRTHCHASLQRSARRRSVKRDDVHCPRTLTPLGFGRSCHKHKSLHDTTEWEAEGKDTTQTGVGAGPSALLRHAQACWRLRQTPSSDVFRARSAQQHQVADT